MPFRAGQGRGEGFRTMKILIAEDDVITSLALAKNIREWGYDVIINKNGEEAWETINSNNIRLAILDWSMPKMDGIELCRKIRFVHQQKKGRYVYIILLTGRDLQEDVITGLSAGADDYVKKPFDPLELKVRIQNGERIIQLEDERLLQASTDSLTKQWNRRGILEFLDDELERSYRHDKPLSTIMMDVDHFKEMNDLYGHQVGDAILVEVASRLKASVRRYDKLGRYGGDEFLVILPDCSFSDTKNIAERLRTAVSEKKVKTAEGPLAVTLSLGCTTSETGARLTAEKLIQLSDSALLLAKKKGRNRVETEGTVLTPKGKKR